MDYDKIVKAYLRMRDAKKQLTKTYEVQKAEIESEMQTLETYFLKGLLDARVKSMSTGAGVFYREQVVQPNCTDWPTYRQFITENDAWDGIEKRVGKGFITQYMKDNDDNTPPGIEVFREQVVRVRRLDEK